MPERLIDNIVGVCFLCYRMYTIFIDSPPEPETVNYTFLSNSYVKLDWSFVDAAKYYLVASYLQEQNESSRRYKFFQTNDTSLTVLYHEGMTVTIHSVNECHMKSSNYTSTAIHMSEASKRACVQLLVYVRPFSSLFHVL